MGRPLRRALITGASSGFGAQFARQLAARGLDLVLVARRTEALRRLADELGVTAEVLTADLADPAGRAAVEQRLRAGRAPVDLLVNNAGFGLYGDFVDLDTDRVRDQIDLHVQVPLRLTRAVLPQLVAAGSGAIVNVSSIAAFAPGPHGAVYAASKTFVLRFTEALHEELRGTGVRALAVCPGVVETGFQQAANVDLAAYPQVLVGDARSVVADALDGLSRDRAVVVPGWPNRVAAAASSLPAPSRIRGWFAGLAHRRFTRGRGHRA